LSFLDHAAIEEIVRSGFDATGRDAGSLPAWIASFTGGHPQRTMQLADACWARTAPGAIAGPECWSDALDDVRRSSQDGMERAYSGFGRAERDVLRAVAHGGSIYGAEAALLDLSKGSATHARQRLIDSGDLISTDAGLCVVDPVFADWIQQRFQL